MPFPGVDWRRAALTWLACALTIACGGQVERREGADGLDASAGRDAREVPGSDPVGGRTGRGRPPSAAGGARPGEAGAAPTGVAGAAPSGDPGTSGRVPRGDQILPLAAGRRWTFRQTRPDPDRADPCGSNLEALVGDRVEFDGMLGWAYLPVCDNDVYHVFIDGDDVDAYDSDDLSEQGRFVYARAPIEDGRTWSSGGRLQTWRDEGSVTTPAGTFDRCWRRFSPEEPDAFVILCRGIGPVIVASTGNNNYLELTSINF